MKCLVCKKPTQELSKNYPLHAECRKEIGNYTRKLAEKVAKEVHEKMEGAELFENYDEILANARKTISIQDTFKALERGEFDED